MIVRNVVKLRLPAEFAVSHVDKISPAVNQA